jgi:O-antigen ligase
MPKVHYTSPIDPQFGLGTLRVAEARRWPFVGLCVYLVSQAFTVPVWAVGPSWVLWPTLSDFAGLFLVAATLLSSNGQSYRIASSKQNKLLFMLILTICGCALSYIVHYSLSNGTTIGHATYREIAQYQLYRLVQFSLLYWASIHIPLSPKRLDTLRKILPLVLTAVCLGLILEFLGIVNPSVYAAHLPRDPGIAGAWSNYIAPGRFGRGTISYDHAYSSVQVLLLLALALHLRGTRIQGIYISALTMLAMIAIWTTGCRAVMVASLVFLAGIYLRKLLDLLTVLAIVTAIVILFAAAFPNVFAVVYKSIVEQSETRALYDVDGIGGREEIWQSRIDFLTEEHTRLLIGGGIGSDTSNAKRPGGGNAHNLYLEILVEHGSIGLIVFLWMISFVMANVYRRDSTQKAVFWAFAAILIASFGQVTLYPIAWTGQFIGFYLVTISIVFRKMRIPSLTKARRYNHWNSDNSGGSVCTT